MSEAIRDKFGITFGEMEEAVSKVADAAYKLDRATYGSHPPEITPEAWNEACDALVKAAEYVRTLQPEWARGAGRG